MNGQVTKEYFLGIILLKSVFNIRNAAKAAITKIISLISDSSIEYDLPKRAIILTPTVLKRNGVAINRTAERAEKMMRFFLEGFINERGKTIMKAKAVL